MNVIVDKPGTHTIQGTGAQADQIFGGDGNDVIMGLGGFSGEDTDQLFGGEGNDTLYGTDSTAVESDNGYPTFAFAYEDYLDGGPGAHELKNSGVRCPHLINWTAHFDQNLGGSRKPYWN